MTGTSTRVLGDREGKPRLEASLTIGLGKTTRELGSGTRRDQPSASMGPRRPTVTGQGELPCLGKAGQNLGGTTGGKPLAPKGERFFIKIHTREVHYG